MSDDLPDPGAGDEPTRDTTRTDDGRDRAVETDSSDAGEPTDEDSEETGDGDERDGDLGETSVPEETDVVDAAWRAAAETGALVGVTDAATGAERRRRTPVHVPTGRLFELLASPGNRFVLTYLLRVDDRAEYAELVEYVVAQTDPPGGLTKATFRGRVAARLVTESLPALADAGLVEVDSDDQVVAATAATHVAAPYLALALSDMVGPVEPE